MNFYNPEKKEDYDIISGIRPHPTFFLSPKALNVLQSLQHPYVFDQNNQISGPLTT
ncbi:hypothetical protein DPMN_024682 [Dreissena polymorpha]|uniref:Uncharacterized protein n=1 Tax=Dreissena polymorpha TaxID=45954 RepID=A0A9D4RBV3_DREPO|nr:hypothetical protein DPMN_024682 [Dreissena polymorpha]